MLTAKQMLDKGAVPGARWAMVRRHPARRNKPEIQKKLYSYCIRVSNKCA